MTELFIIADDFTGALDTGVHFAAGGAKTLVITDPQADLSRVPADVRVLVMDAETRHLPAKEAYDIVYRACAQAAELGIPHIFKKTDSALRGNIGAELSAALKASGAETLPFIPALPGMGRVTRGGVHYIKDVPVAESVFGQDPFEPVTESDVCKMITMQSDTPAVSVTAPGNEKGIAVYDCESNERLKALAEELNAAGGLRVMAGCAGLGTVLPELLGLTEKEHQPMPKLDECFTVLCGSVNPITLAQLAYADEHGFGHVHITPEQKLTDGYFDTEAGKAVIAEWKKLLADNRLMIFDANDLGGNEPTSAWAKEHGLTVSDLRVKIAHTLGRIMKELFEEEGLGTLLVTGGDTLLQCMNSVGVYALEPICEMYSGVVLSRFSIGDTSRFVISKSGGFGQASLLNDMVDKYM